MAYNKDKQNIYKLGLAVKKARLNQGISQEQLAFESNLTRSQISRLERGILNTSVSTIFSIAKALNLHPKDFFDFDFDFDKNMHN